MSDKKEQIIQSAIKMIRTGGYNAFSFREIADDVGIKSSSVHHYFRRKENLAIAVAESYRDSFFEQLGNPNETKSSPKEKFQHYSNVFIEAFQKSGKACLCGMLSHESPGLPGIVIAEVNNFIDRNIDWLIKAYSSDEPTDQDAETFAILTYSALEGAMAVATVKGDVNWLKKTQAQLDTQFDTHNRAHP